MEWANELQRGILHEYVEGVQEDSSPEAKKALRKRIAKKWELSASTVQAVVDLMAVEGVEKVKNPKYHRGEKTYQPINYHREMKEMKQRLGDLEGKFNYILERIEQVLDDGATMAIHLQQLRNVGRQLTKRGANMPELPLEGIVGKGILTRG
jgi:transposase